MLNVLGQWIFRAFVSMAACFLLTYAVDWTVFHLRGSPMATATVNRYLEVPLKGRKEEFDFLGTFTVPCSVSLFPQGGHDPCWRLRQHPDEWDDL